MLVDVTSNLFVTIIYYYLNKIWFPSGWVMERDLTHSAVTEQQRPRQRDGKSTDLLASHGLKHLLQLHPKLLDVVEEDAGLQETTTPSGHHRGPISKVTRNIVTTTRI